MIGITERGDAAIHHEWKSWVNAGEPAILITKDPGGLLEHATVDMNIIIHATITGFGGTKVEPGVPHPTEALDGYRQLCDLFGEARVVLRIDPIIPTEKGIRTATMPVLKRARGRVRASFLDNYPHVKERFRKAGLPVLPYDFHAPLEQRKRIHGELEVQLGQEIEICGEPGMACTGCVSMTDMDTLLVTGLARGGGQRKACACLSLKKELLNHRGQCKHGCLYCYWR